MASGLIAEIADKNRDAPKGASLVLDGNFCSFLGKHFIGLPRSPVGLQSPLDSVSACGENCIRSLAPRFRLKNTSLVFETSWETIRKNRDAPKGASLVLDGNFCFFHRKRFAGLRRKTLSLAKSAEYGIFIENIPEAGNHLTGEEILLSFFAFMC